MTRTAKMISPSQSGKKRKFDSSPAASTKKKNKKKKPTKKNKKEKTLSRSLSGSSVASICNSLASIKTVGSTDLSNLFSIPDRKCDTDTWTKVVVTKHVSNPNLDSYTMQEMRSKNGPQKTLHNFLQRNSASSHWEADNWKVFIDGSLDKYGSKEHRILVDTCIRLARTPPNFVPGYIKLQPYQRDTTILPFILRQLWN
jgi:hypothetical protein